MEQVFNFLDGLSWVWTVVILLFAGITAASAVADFAKEKRIGAAEMVLRLSAGVALMAVCLLQLLGLVRGDWIWATMGIFFGMLLVLEGIDMISYTTVGLRKGLAVLAGAIFLLWGVGIAISLVVPK
ncbi:MAG: hypothetical protein ACOYXY_11600 [Thermodesulfobacteriota bacterium]